MGWDVLGWGGWDGMAWDGTGRDGPPEHAPKEFLKLVVVAWRRNKSLQKLEHNLAVDKDWDGTIEGDVLPCAARPLEVHVHRRRVVYLQPRVELWLLALSILATSMELLVDGADEVIAVD